MPAVNGIGKSFLLALFGLAILCAPTVAAAAEGNTNADPNTEPAPNPEAKATPTKTSDELLVFQDLPVVISASRQEEKIGRTSVPVSVVTKDDIHYSGATTLPDIFQFVPGVDVISFDRNRHAIGVRGLHEYYSERTLMLINGRNAESTRFGGPEPTRYPLMMEDIERIEVVRGPGGAAWGANAFNGVINILTKKPEDTQGILATSTVDVFGDTSSQVRWGANKGKWYWRTSFGYQESESSDDAIDNDDFESLDYRKAVLFDGQADYRLSEDTRVSFGVGYQYEQLGPFEDGTLAITDSDRLHTVRAFARADHCFNNGMSGYLQWYGNFTENDEPWLMKSHSSQNDLEAQLSFTVANDHHFTVGANGRWTRIGCEREKPSDFYLPGQPFDEYQVGAFVMDRWQVNRRLIFEAQARGDWYSETQLDWSTRLAVLFSLDEQQHHVLRFGGARAFRTPQVGLRDLYSYRQLGNFVINFRPPDEGLRNEGIASFEAGYNGQLTHQISLRLDGYYQRFSDLIGIESTTNIVGPPPFPPTVVSELWPTPIDGGEAYGGEAELAVTGHIGRLSAWYAYNAFDPDQHPQNVRAYYPAKNKAGLNGRLFLPHQVTLNAQYRYNDLTRSSTPRGNPNVQSYHRLDFSVSKQFAGERAELMLGVRDVLNDTSFIAIPQSSYVGHETPGRTFFGRLQLKF